MKDIKFRAFHKPSKKMFNVGMIDFKNKVIIEDTENKHWFHECELIQYTGLTDCEGKEIFEGDIIQDLIGLLYKVTWDNKSSCYCYETGYTSFSFMTSYVNKFKIVGNIHQNSELL